MAAFCRLLPSGKTCFVCFFPSQLNVWSYAVEHANALSGRGDVLSFRDSELHLDWLNVEKFQTSSEYKHKNE